MSDDKTTHVREEDIEVISDNFVDEDSVTQLVDRSAHVKTDMFAPGARLLGRYEVIRTLGAGGFGGVVEARSDEGIKVAIKYQLTGDGDSEQRFKGEIDLLQQITHANVITIHGWGVVDGKLLMVLDYLDGVDLGKHLDEHGPLSPRATRALTLKILDGLDAAHKKGVIHRDIKPQNVVLAIEPGQDVGHADVRLIDFGIATVTEDFAKTFVVNTAEGMIPGSMPYMAPEFFDEEKASIQSDLYAVGLLMLACLTGKNVVSGKTSSKIFASLRERTIEVPASLRQDPLAEIAWKASRKSPSDRYASAREMYDELDRLNDLSEDALSTEDGTVIKIDDIPKPPELEAPFPNPTPLEEPEKTGNSWIPVIILLLMASIGAVVFLMWAQAEDDVAGTQKPPPPVVKWSLEFTPTGAAIFAGGRHLCESGSPCVIDAEMLPGGDRTITFMAANHERKSVELPQGGGAMKIALEQEVEDTGSVDNAGETSTTSPSTTTSQTNKQSDGDAKTKKPSKHRDKVVDKQRPSERQGKKDNKSDGGNFTNDLIDDLEQSKKPENDSSDITDELLDGLNE